MKTNPKAFIDLTGKTFNYLTAVKYIGKSRWLCRCCCGKETEVLGQTLRELRQKSCGCMKSQLCRASAIKHGEYIHGKPTPEMKAWHTMITRCTDPTSARYGCYGARGISVCDRWRDSFPAFLEDMGRRPSPEHSIDRIDVNGNYEPSNCRWATREEQSRNKQNTVYMTFRGEKKPMAEWAKISGIAYATLICRRKGGWDDATALLTPVQKRFK